ncbi:MAG: fenitrothion hydrolase, partial [Solirubrobacteraceae bacterium]
LVFLVTVYAGLAGSDVDRDNLAPWVVYVALWVGVPFVSLFLGDVWRLISPWRAIGRASGWLMARVTDPPEPLAYPARLGRWPAALGVAGFGICELCWATAREPAPVAIIMLVYLVVMLVGMSLYGVEAWTRNADPLGVYFSLFASLAPVTRHGGALYARPPVVGAGRIDGSHGTAAVIITGLGVTAFDGASEGPLFNDILPNLQDFFGGLGLNAEKALELGFVTGMLVAIGIIALIWSLAVRGMPPIDGRRPGAALVHSLVPILAAYVVAHYFSLFVYNGQDLWRLASDPLGDGSDLFGGAGSTIDYNVIDATQIWWVQICVLVAGHVVGLVLAHDRALVLYGSHRDATRSQLVMLVLMVVFTCLGLWLLSAANG